ncbi:MAG: DMT family transporter [Rhizobiaceae bacterium]|nr:MAG: DMT family transporter [Rhizobiaceae bacterium]CAG1008045.1 hypothetical protein RHIZO_03447 [Rhizobiaceae bacterium]
MLRTAIATSVAMVAFAANSLLARLALGDGAADAAGYTSIRLVSGAVALAAIVAAFRKRRRLLEVPGNWISAFALFAYAVAFSFAYLDLGAATGALVLFASVQATMILWGISRGDRPSPLQVAGFVIAFAAFVYLVLPGLRVPDPRGTAMMILSGVSWGVYSLRGRGLDDPLAETAGNFVRSVPLCLLLAPLAWPGAEVTQAGVGLALLSGVVASGMGYAVWYHVVPRLGTTRAALVQLTVPVIAAVGAVVLLAEPLSLRFVIASICVLGGVGIGLVSGRARR